MIGPVKHSGDRPIDCSVCRSVLAAGWEAAPDPERLKAESGAHWPELAASLAWQIWRETGIKPGPYVGRVDVKMQP